MAEKRMFAKSIVLSDAFLDMPMSARCLYFTLNMFADDDGFVGSPKGIMRQCGASQDDLTILLQKRFVLGFESGVIVIKHWRIHNTLRMDRYNPTTYVEEIETLQLDDKKAYTEKEGWLPNGCQMVATDKISIDKINDISNDISIEEPEQKKPVKHKYGEYNNVLLTDEELEKLKGLIPNYKDYIERLSGYVASKGVKYKSHYATIRNWFNKDVKEGKNVEVKQYEADRDNFLDELFKGTYV